MVNEDYVVDAFKYETYHKCWKELDLKEGVYGSNVVVADFGNNSGLSRTASPSNEFIENLAFLHNHIIF